MRGLLVNNRFLRGKAYSETEDLLRAAAEKAGASLEQADNAECSARLLRGGIEADFAIFFDKDIRLAQQLEDAGVAVFNRASAIEKCDDKSLTYLALKDSGIALPRTVIGEKLFFPSDRRNDPLLEAAADILGFPMVVKECFGSFGRQVYLARDPGELLGICEKIAERPMIMQEYIAGSAGRDLRVNVVGGRTPASILRTGTGDFRSNVSLGGSARAAEPTPEQRQTALRACEILGLDFAGVDLLFGEDGRPVLCEVNSNPHFASTLKATGTDLAPLIIEHIIGKLGKR